MTRPATRSPLERELQRRIEAAIGSEPDLLLLRNSVGQAEYVTDDGRSFFVPYGLGVGSPDIVGILRVRTRSNDPLDPPRTLGTWFCLEVKTDKGTLSDEQLKCHHVWRKFGAFVAVVRSVEDARAALANARKGIDP